MRLHIPIIGRIDHVAVERYVRRGDVNASMVGEGVNTTVCSYTSSNLYYLAHSKSYANAGVLNYYVNRNTQAEAEVLRGPCVKQDSRNPQCERRIGVQPDHDPFVTIFNMRGLWIIDGWKYFDFGSRIQDSFLILNRQARNLLKNIKPVKIGRFIHTVSMNNYRNTRNNFFAWQVEEV